MCPAVASGPSGNHHHPRLQRPLRGPAVDVAPTSGVNALGAAAQGAVPPSAASAGSACLPPTATAGSSCGLALVPPFPIDRILYNSGRDAGGTLDSSPLRFVLRTSRTFLERVQGAVSAVAGKGTALPSAIHSVLSRLVTVDILYHDLVLPQQMRACCTHGAVACMGPWAMVTPGTSQHPPSCSRCLGGPCTA